MFKMSISRLGDYREVLFYKTAQLFSVLTQIVARFVNLSSSGLCSACFWFIKGLEQYLSRDCSLWSRCRSSPRKRSVVGDFCPVAASTRVSAGIRKK